VKNEELRNGLVLVQVLVDDTDIRDYKLEWVRSQIGVVNQEPVVSLAAFVVGISSHFFKLMN
jgi:ABC-type transport system involved in Fe-S cluster assembly fused permease/ATPase subunit